MFYNGLVHAIANDNVYKIRGFGALPNGAAGADNMFSAVIAFGTYDALKVKRIVGPGEEVLDYAYTSIEDYWFHKLFG